MAKSHIVRGGSMEKGKSDVVEIYFTPDVEEFYKLFHFCTDCLVFPSCHSVLRVFNDNQVESHHRVTVRPCLMFSRTFTEYKRMCNMKQGWHTIRPLRKILCLVGLLLSILCV